MTEMKKAQWAIDAETECAANGHPSYHANGRCTRCATWDEAHDMECIREARRIAAMSADDDEDGLYDRRCKLYTTDQGCPLHGETCR